MTLPVRHHVTDKSKNTQTSRSQYCPAIMACLCWIAILWLRSIIPWVGYCACQSRSCSCVGGGQVHLPILVPHAAWEIPAPVATPLARARKERDADDDDHYNSARYPT